MAEQKEPPRPHGDPLEDELLNNGVEENAAQRQSDATDDAVAMGGTEEPTRGTTSDANGLSAGDDADGARRKRQYKNGAEIVSRID